MKNREILGAALILAIPLMAVAMTSKAKASLVMPSYSFTFRGTDEALGAVLNELEKRGNVTNWSLDDSGLSVSWVPIDKKAHTWVVDTYRDSIVKR